MTRPDPDHLVVGHISKPHGIRGEVLVWPLTDRPEDVLAPGGELILGDTEGEIGRSPETVTIETARPYKRGVLLKFRDYADRTAVESIVKRYLLAPVERLEALEEGDFFYHELLGLEVVTADGERVGRVREVFETEPTHLLEVKAEGGRIHLVPFSEQIVQRIDLESRQVTIDPPEGLLEL